MVPAMPTGPKLPTYLYAVLAVLLTIALAGCDSASGPAIVAEDNTVRQVTVVGTGEVQATPDTLTINAAIETVANEAANALNQTSQRQKAVIDALLAGGIDREDISTSEISVQPQYAGGNSTFINGYRATNSIDIKVRQIERAPDVFGAIAANGGDAMRINNVSLTIEDDDQLVREARAHAFNDAHSRAEQYALLAEVDLGKVISISEAPSTTPPPLPYQGTRDGAAEMAAVPIEPGRQTISFTVTVVYELD